MKKFIAAFDGLKYSKSTADCAIQLARQNNAQLVGVFLDDFTYTSYKVLDLVSDKGELSVSLKKKLDQQDQDTRTAAVRQFETACRKAGLQHSIHHDRSIAIQELIHETIFADLVIINENETLTHYHENQPTAFISYLLAKTQCPVLIVPSEFTPIEKLVLLYDGEPDSVFAIKMLSYLLPSLTSLPAEISWAKSAESSSHIPNNTLIKELIRRHFPNAVYNTIKGEPEVGIPDYLRHLKGNPLVVLGAYHRGAMSRWLKQSLADVLLRKARLPLFIAHKK